MVRSLVTFNVFHHSNWAWLGFPKIGHTLREKKLLDTQRWSLAEKKKKNTEKKSGKTYGGGREISFKKEKRWSQNFGYHVNGRMRYGQIWKAMHWSHELAIFFRKV